jgi:hypothetical protein
MDELQPDIDQIRIEIEEAMKGLRNGCLEHQRHEPILMPSLRKSVRL